MAEININQAHAHSYERFTGGALVDTLHTFEPGSCGAGHTNCCAVTIGWTGLLERVRHISTSGSLGKRTGEINANPRHRHSYIRFSGTGPTSVCLVNITTCPLGHLNCEVVSVTTRSDIATGGSDESLWSGWGQASGEINLNANHQHTFSRNRTAGGSKLWGTCPAGHGYCQDRGYNELILTLSVSANFDPERLL